MSIEIDDIDDDEIYESAVKKADEKRKHNELTGLLKQVVIAINKDTGKDAKVLETINAYLAANNVFLDKVKELSKGDITVKSPDVKVNVDNNALAAKIGELNEMVSTMIEGQDELIKVLKNKPTRLKANRGFTGVIDTVDVIYGIKN